MKMNIALQRSRKSLHSFLALFFFISTVHAYTVTELQAVKYNGQVFLTWKNPAQTNLQYNVYRSSTPITSATQLNGTTYLGFVRDNSAKNIRKSTLYGGSHYYKITSTAAPLTSDRGLYVATCTASGNYYYAVTVVTLSNNQEDKSVINSSNSLVAPISESIANPQPVLQFQGVENDGTLRYEYAQWGNNQSPNHYPAFNNCGSFAWNFTVFKTGNSTNKSIYVLFKDDDPFSVSGINICEDCNVLKLDDYLPNGGDSYWTGWNDSYNIYSSTNSVPNSGIVKMYTQTRLKETIEWAKKGISADSNKVYLTGISHNAFGALITSQLWPGMVTAVYAKNAPILIKALNNSTREEQWCNTSDNFDTDYLDPNTGVPIPVWKLFNMCHMYKVNTNRGGPFTAGINGKQDVTVGWIQKFFWYDSLNASRLGGAWYWDQRTHTNSGAKFTDEEVTPDYERFTLARSFPAFSYCSANQNPGNGTPSNGAPWGAINGYLDWNDASIADNPNDYAITCFVKNLYAGGTLAAEQYDSCNTDITFQRLQKFKPTVGQTISWKVKNSSNKIVQQGSFTYTGGIITLFGVKIYKTNSVISMSTGSCSTVYYVDADNDGYGSSSDPGSTSCTPPAGKVTNNTDCNDGNNAIKPGAQEICDANDVDEDCDGLKDDADASVTGKITYYPDSDHDNYGSSSAAGTAYCNPPAWYTTNKTDCNDANAAIKPGAQEVCDANDVDEDCDGQTDDSDASVTGKITYYPDADHDNFGSAIAAGIAYCNPPAWFTTNKTDCNDANAAIYPGKAEACNLLDDDCDLLIDENAGIIYYADNDDDNYGNILSFVITCTMPNGYTTNNTDCNDNNAGINPGAAEICNSVDDNCNILIDDGAGGITYYLDADSDSYGNPLVSITTCNTPPVGFVTNGNDCNDLNSLINPAAIDICDGIDNNCNSLTDENAIEVTITLSGSATGCKSESITLTATGSDIESYKWYKGTNPNSVAGQTNSTYTLNYDNTTVKAVVSNSFGCTATSETVTLSSILSPSATITVLNGGNLDLCSGAVTLSTSGGENYTRQWYRNDMEIAGATGTTHVPSTAGSYTLKVTNNSGCSKTSSTVPVIGLVTYYIDADGDGFGSSSDPGTVYCETPQGAVTNNGDCNDANNNINPGAADICDGKDNNCNGITDENAITVTVDPPGPVSGCKLELFTLTASGTNIETYEWFKGNGSNSVAGQTSPSYTLAYENTSVKAVVANSFGCTATSNTVSITSIANPSATISTANSNLCLGSVVLTASGGASMLWQWYYNGIMIPGATNNSYSALSAGSYEVNVENVSTGCNKQSSPFTVTNSCKTTSPFLSENLRLEIYPNPSNGIFAVNLEKTGTSDVIIKVFDITGRIIYLSDKGLLEGNYETKLDLSKQSAGIYLLEVLVGGEGLRKQLLIQ
jgi:hypothetical protein